MMLQGHLVDTMLDPVFRDKSHWLYYSWAFMRGITAPVFFFSAGLVFTYLLTRKNQHWKTNVRLTKGLGRGLQLIGLGYLLRMNFLALIFKGEIYNWVWGADVLHIIGLSLLILCGLYILHQEMHMSLPWLLGLAGFCAFYFEPVFNHTDWSTVPGFLSAYMHNSGYSTFTLFPWVGYALFGGVGGVMLARFPQVARSWWLPVSLIISGLLFHYFSIKSLIDLYRITGMEGFIAWRIVNSHVLIRLGDVWVVMGLIIMITRLWKNMPALIPRIGSETLTIYSVHYIVLWGTWFGLGINRLGSKTWDPWMSGIGALLFVAAFVMLIKHIDAVRAWWDVRFRQPARSYYRLIRFKWNT